MTMRKMLQKKLDLAGDNVQNKILGIGWNNKLDELMFYTQIEYDANNIITKRIILWAHHKFMTP